MLTNNEVALLQLDKMCFLFATANLLYKSRLYRCVSAQVQSWLGAWSFDDESCEATLPLNLRERYLSAVASFRPKTVASMTQRERQAVSQWNTGFADCFLYAMLETGSSLAVSRVSHQLASVNSSEPSELRLVPIAVDVSIDVISLPDIPVDNDMVIQLICGARFEQETVVGGFIHLDDELTGLGHTIAFVASEDSRTRYYDTKTGHVLTSLTQLARGWAEGLELRLGQYYNAATARHAVSEVTLVRVRHQLRSVVVTSICG